MIVITFTIFGALLGALNARRQKGTAADIAQYAAATGIAFAIIGLLVTIVIARLNG